MVASGFIFGFCAFIMVGLGISQLRSKAPVGFYTGEKPPSAEEITDVHAWNKKHGTMWVLYGVVMILSWIIGTLLGDTPSGLIVLLSGVLVPVLVMIWYHHKLIKRYKKS